nr:diacylglycerol kinase [Paraburkholderia phosphatilytica]
MPDQQHAGGDARASHANGDDSAHVEPFDDAIDTHERELHTAGVQPLRPLAPRPGATQNRGMSEPATDAPAAPVDRTDDETAPQSGEPLSPDDPFAPLPFNPYKGNRGVTRAWHAMKNSFAGFRVAIREESAFRQELTLAAILVPCGVLVPVDAVARVLLLGSVLLVLIVELLNSSVEAAIDRISLERHELSRRAKDLGSAAVMVALGMCVMTWVLIVGPLVVHWIRGWFQA